MGIWYGLVLNLNVIGSGGGSFIYGFGGKGGGYFYLEIVREL